MSQDLPAPRARHINWLSELPIRIVKGTRRREQLYDLLYSLSWGETTTNNYGFAPAEGGGPERFQLQLYGELLKLLNESPVESGLERVVEISCGRGGGLHHLARRLPPGTRLIGLDFSAHAIAFCQRRYAPVADLHFVRGNALHLPFNERAIDVAVSVEASHAYGDDAAFLREVARVLRPGGRFLLADYRTRRKVHRLEQLAHAAGLRGELRDITPNVVSACELDAERRRGIIRSGVPWHYRLLFSGSIKRYSGLPGTVTYERFRNGDRMYFLSCMTRVGFD
jgi:ubiquinone/menaquinone biosynthesis C-methylase UbiE